MKKIRSFVLSILVLFVFINLANAQEKVRISIATSVTGGVYYPFGGAIAEIINKLIPKATATAEVTGASVGNVRLVGQGKASLGFTMNDTLYDAYVGTGKFKDNKIDSLRTILQAYPNVFHIVTLKKSPIKKITDLKDKKVSVGAPGSGTEYKSSLVFPLLGIDYKDMKVYRLSFLKILLS